MANTKEILDRMNGIKDTMKITNAMYLISSSKIRKARKNMEQVKDYFQAVRDTIGNILVCMPDMEHRYLEKARGAVGKNDWCTRKRAYLVITADKGLAGAYNLNVIKKTEAELMQFPQARLFVIGQIGLHHFENTGVEIEKDFFYSSQNPSLQRARSITADLMEPFRNGEIDEIFVIFTRMKNVLQSDVAIMKLFPLSRSQFVSREEGRSEESFFPEPKAVFNQIAPLTMQGVIFSALTESYCAELNDRMTAMDGASKSASEMIEDLELLYNRTRQGTITQEITEIIAGSRAQKKKKMQG